METITFDNDIKVMYVTAKSFPEGILEAHRKLHAKVAFSKERRYFGLSRPENGLIVYKAAVEETRPGEAKKLNLETLSLKKGKYISETIRDFMKDAGGIRRTFKTLLDTPGLDPDGYCVEWYFNEKDVHCLVRLNSH